MPLLCGHGHSCPGLLFAFEGGWGEGFSAESMGPWGWLYPIPSGMGIGLPFSGRGWEHSGLDVTFVPTEGDAAFDSSA